MADQSRVDRIETYLREQFPNHTWLSKASGDGGVYFSAQGSSYFGRPPHFVRITADVMEQEDPVALLRECGLVRRLQSVAGERRVVVSTTGLTAEEI